MWGDQERAFSLSTIESKKSFQLATSASFLACSSCTTTHKKHRKNHKEIMFSLSYNQVKIRYMQVNIALQSFQFNINSCEGHLEIMSNLKKN